MAYKALYRTYRPQNFEEVYGQEVIIKTLKNTIRNNKISHAYLFSGPRGIGKTTIARIFAKALNCSGIHNGEPCCQCESCLSVATNSHPDVIEIDAASNNGVDEIREIRDKVKFLPVGAKYKIYIIDEVHMLSTGAFNALLKTLEEPPHHAVFILATTELHKIPATIVSRCQCYEFKGLSNNEIVKNLQSIATSEGVEVTEEALRGIAEASFGGMRDALSFLDQAISYSDGVITIDEVNEITGALDEEKVIDIALFLEHKNITGAMQIVNEFIFDGKEPSKIINSLLELYRDILLHRNINGETLITKRVFERETFKELVDVISDENIFYYVDVLSDVNSKLRYSTTPNIYLEISLVKLVNASGDAVKLSKRIQEIESRLNSTKVATHVVSDSSSDSVSGEKLLLLENKVNRVVKELSQLELPQVIERVRTLEINQDNKPKETNTFNKDLTQIQEDLLILKTSTSSLQNQLDNIPHVDDVRPSSVIAEEVKASVFEIINKRLYEMDVKIDRMSGSINTEALHLLDEKIEEMNSLKKSVFEHKYTRESDYDINEIKDKIINIENKLYKYISVITSNEAVPIKKSKAKAGEVIGVYGEGIFGLDEVSKTKVNIDFEDLQKEDSITSEESVKPQKEVKSKKEVLEDSAENFFEEPNLQEELPGEEITEETAIEEIKTFEDESKKIVEDESVIEEKEIKEVSKKVKPNKTGDATRDEINLFNILSGSVKEEKEVTTVEKEDGTLITKTNSQLYKRNNSNGDLSENNIKDLFAQEREELDRDIKQIKGEAQDDPENYKLDEFSAYDVKVVERILNDSRSENARNDKARVLKIWNIITRDVDPESLHIADLLHQGQITAVGNKEFILIYPTSALCNQVMRMRFKKESLKLLYDLLGDAYNYLALPENVWQEKRTEYHSQYYTGTQNIKLTPINDPSLTVSKDNQEYLDEKRKAINKVKEMFGSELVTVE